MDRYGRERGVVSIPGRGAAWKSRYPQAMTTQQALEAAEARYADALAEIRNALDLAEKGNVSGCVFLLSTYLEGIKQARAKGKDADD